MGTFVEEPEISAAAVQPVAFGPPGFASTIAMTCALPSSAIGMFIGSTALPSISAMAMPRQA